MANHFLSDKKIIYFKLTLFIIVTASAVFIMFCFPNLPPPFNKFFIKHRVTISKNQSIDSRFLAWFNRDPERKIPAEPRIVISPADGYILGIKQMNNAHHIIIEMRYTDVHVQRIPISGKVISIKGDGNKLDDNANISEYWSDKMLPFQKITVLDTEIGKVTIRQITSFFANRIKVFVKEGEVVERGERLGRILAGSTIVLELPDTVTILVSLGQNVLAGETIVAKY